MVVLILLLGAGVSSILFFIRFLRWKHFVTMWNAGMPHVAEIEGEVGGQKFGIKLNEAQDRQLAALADEVAALKKVQTLQGNVLRQVVEHVTRKESE